MPITSALPIRPISQSEFPQIDFQVMRHAFDSQNELGRLCDEVIYQNDLAARLECAGLGPVRKEVPVTVSHRDFAKTYSLDLVVRDTSIYELKTATQIVGDNEAQLLNYLFLRDSHHGKLINFRPPQIESRFVNTNLTPQARRQLKFHTERWREDEEISRSLRATMCALLEDWGWFLDIALYTEALVHFFGGEEKVWQLVPLSRKGLPLGNQRFHLLTPAMAFRLTALPENLEGYERQLRSLLGLAPIQTIQWINVARHKIQFVTLSKQLASPSHRRADFSSD